jgi:hypothetical protein
MQIRAGSIEENRVPDEIDTKPNILLIDDEGTICRVLKGFLESTGHLLTVSPETGEALETFWSNASGAESFTRVSSGCIRIPAEGQGKRGTE